MFGVNYPHESVEVRLEAARAELKRGDPAAADKWANDALVFAVNQRLPKETIEKIQRFADDLPNGGP
ncbi:MAG: hypothetical protein ACLP9Y_00335 [Mycobacterium sp.]